MPVDRPIGVNAAPGGRQTAHRRNSRRLHFGMFCNQNRGRRNDGGARGRHGLLDDANNGDFVAVVRTVDATLASDSSGALAASHMALGVGVPRTRGVCRGLTIRLPSTKAKAGKQERAENGRELPSREQRKSFGLDKEPDQRKSRKQGQARRRDDAGETN